MSSNSNSAETNNLEDGVAGQLAILEARINSLEAHFRPDSLFLTNIQGLVGHINRVTAHLNLISKNTDHRFTLLTNAHTRHFEQVAMRRIELEQLFKERIEDQTTDFTTRLDNQAVDFGRRIEETNKFLDRLTATFDNLHVDDLAAKVQDNANALQELNNRLHTIAKSVYQGLEAIRAMVNAAAATVPTQIPPPPPPSAAPLSPLSPPPQVPSELPPGDKQSAPLDQDDDDSSWSSVSASPQSQKTVLTGSQVASLNMDSMDANSEARIKALREKGAPATKPEAMEEAKKRTEQKQAEFIRQMLEKLGMDSPASHDKEEAKKQDEKWERIRQQAEESGMASDERFKQDLEKLGMKHSSIQKAIIGRRKVLLTQLDAVEEVVKLKRIRQELEKPGKEPTPSDNKSLVKVTNPTGVNTEGQTLSIKQNVEEEAKEEAEREKRINQEMEKSGMEPLPSDNDKHAANQATVPPPVIANGRAKLETTEKELSSSLDPKPTPAAFTIKGAAARKALSRSPALHSAIPFIPTAPVPTPQTPPPQPPSISTHSTRNPFLPPTTPSPAPTSTSKYANLDHQTHALVMRNNIGLDIMTSEDSYWAPRNVALRAAALQATATPSPILTDEQRSHLFRERLAKVGVRTSSHNRRNSQRRNDGVEGEGKGDTVCGSVEGGKRSREEEEEEEVYENLDRFEEFLEERSRAVSRAGTEGTEGTEVGGDFLL
ncbi:MAG: hypothetical protein Q9169_002652 [Polycauliona sp. 2 TL-2023]